MTAFSSTIDFTVLTCFKCNCKFGLDDVMYKRRIADKNSFWCPNGHQQHFLGESSSDRAQRLAGELDMARTRLRDRDQQLDYARRARKNVSTRLKKVKQRVGHGVCPCCNRTFKALAEHMATQHPTYAVSADDHG